MTFQHPLPACAPNSCSTSVQAAFRSTATSWPPRLPVPPGLQHHLRRGSQPLECNPSQRCPCTWAWRTAATAPPSTTARVQWPVTNSSEVSAAAMPAPAQGQHRLPPTATTWPFQMRFLRSPTTTMQDAVLGHIWRGQPSQRFSEGCGEKRDEMMLSASSGTGCSTSSGDPATQAPAP